MITSPDNMKLKEIRRLGRRAGREKLGLFTAEGEDLVLGALDAGWVARGVFVPGSEPSPLPEELRPIPVRDDLLAEHSQLGSSTRALGVYKQRWSKPGGDLSVALWGVRDPGNLGTVLRSADAFAADRVVLGPRCADPYAPKSVRASMGAIFTVPVARVAEVEELPGRTVAFVVDDGVPLHEAATELAASDEPITLVIGNEREGLAPGVANACFVRVTIPMARDSVNAAMAATIALYEIARARAARRQDEVGA